MKRKIYRGWIVAICCTMLAFSINAMGNNSMSFYITPVAEAFGVNRVSMNTAMFTVGMFVRTIVGFFYGKLEKKFGTKPLMFFGCSMALLAYFMFSRSTGLLSIALGSGIYGIAHSIGTFGAYNTIINNWFIERKGLMIGFVNMSIGLGGMVISPLVGGWIQYSGWKNSFLFTGLLIGAIAIPAITMIKVHPTDMGALAYGGNSTVAVAEAVKAKPLLSLGGAMKKGRFWVLVCMQLCVGINGSAILNVVPSLTGAGLDPLYISAVLAVLLSLGIAVGNITSGMLYDKFGLRVMMLVIGGILGTGMLLMTTIGARSSVLLTIIAVMCMGYGNSMSLGTVTHYINNVFGYRTTDFSAMFGFLFAVGSAGSMIGAPISGKIFDLTGSYSGAYLMSAGLLAVTLCLMQVVLMMSKKEVTTS
jgi:MFS family permease